jgi:hypothetical protein
LNENRTGRMGPFKFTFKKIHFPFQIVIIFKIQN